MTRNLRLAILLLLGLSAAGCAHITVPEYTGNLDLADRLAKAGSAKVALGPFTAEPGTERLKGRTNRFHSPKDDSFGAYLREALGRELAIAQRYDERSPVVIEANLVENELDISGTHTGSIDMAADFRVRRDGKLAYQRRHRLHHEWPSSALGVLAIPFASSQAPVATRRLLELLIDDPQFQAAIR